ncbi:MAG: hypothetical protein U0W24_02345 [Bacteroidales bacterium]
MELEYEEQDDNKLPGYGTPISIEMAREIIKNYRDYVNNDKKVPHAFTFGKESLLAILSQPGCEGIRFYLAKKEENPGIDGWKKGITLVAIGVKPDIDPNTAIGHEPEIGAEPGKKYLDEDLDTYAEIRVKRIQLAARLANLTVKEFSDLSPKETYELTENMAFPNEMKLLNKTTTGLIYETIPPFP